MARVRSFPDGRITISMSIAEPLAVLAVSFMIVPLASFLIVALTIKGIFEGRLPVATALPILALCSPVVIVSGCLSFWMTNQIWEFNRLNNRIAVRRGPIVVRTESLHDLVILRLDVIGDGDGGSGRAFLVYRNGQQIPVNRVGTDSINELKAFTDAANRYLSIQND